MQISILVSGITATVFFILSVLSFTFKWGNFKLFAIIFLVTTILMFILMIIRNVREEWKIGNYKRKDQAGDS